MTDLDIYQPPAQIEQYQARMVMTPEAARALDEQVRLCTRAVLREGTDFGIIPGAGGRKVLFKPGAEKLLQWFGFGFTCDRTDLEVDEDGQKQGVTYRCTITKQLPEGRIAAVTTCEGYAGYDELKFFKPVSDTERHKAEARERGWAKKDGRPADPTKWKNITAYRAPWNTLLKMAQKRAIVGAAITATAAAGLFGQEEEEGPVAEDGGMSAYQLLVVRATRFTDPAEADPIQADAAQAHRDGLLNRGQADYIQNTARKRAMQLKGATPVDVEDLGRQDPEPETEQVSNGLVGIIQAHFKRLGFGDDERDNRLAVTGKIARRDITSTRDLTQAEARNVKDELAGCKDRAELVALLADAQPGTDGDGDA